MTALKKFMFDNFTIETPKKIKEAVNIDVVDKVEEIALISDEVVVEEPVLVQSIQEVDTSEFEEKLKKATEDAYNKGVLEGKEVGDKSLNKLLIAVNDNIGKLLNSDCSDVEEEYKKNTAELANAILEKLIPTLEKQEASNIVKKFLEENFNSFKIEKKLSIHLNPNSVAEISKVVASLADKNDFEGKISIIKDASLLESDCKVMWDFGGVALDYGQKVNEIKEVFKN